MSIGIIYSDINESISSNEQGDFKKSINMDALKTSIDNILRTRPTERVMLRSFGSSIMSLLFDSIDETMLTLVADEIKNALERWDNRIILRKIDFDTSVRSRNQLGIIINFTARGFDNIFSYNATLEQGS